jgi:hypothetical protein
MKRIIRLTERDLTRIVKRTIREMENDIDDSVRSEEGYRNQIIRYLNYNGIDPKSDDEIRDGLLDLRRQGDNRATMFIRRLSKYNR